MAAGPREDEKPAPTSKALEEIRKLKNASEKAAREYLDLLERIKKLEERIASEKQQGSAEEGRLTSKRLPSRQ